MKTQGSRASLAPVSQPVRLPKKWPHEVSSGDVTVKIYRTRSVVKGTTYPTFTLSYFANGKRQRKQFADYADALKQATAVADQKAQGALGAAALTAENRVALQAALTKLAEHEGTGNATAGRLVEIVLDYAAATRELPTGSTLAEAVRYFAQRHPANMARRSVAEVVLEFIADRRSAGCSEIHLRDMGIRLASQFCHAFGGKPDQEGKNSLPINQVSPQTVQQWLYNLKRATDGRPASARSRENMLRMVASLFNFARRMKYVPAELAVEIAEIPTPKKQHAPIGIYTPNEIAAILAQTEADVVPALAIAAFAGLRLAEVARLDWRDVRLAERLIVVDAGNAKTAARRLVPISDNLATWLATHVRPFGPVNPAVETHGGNVGHSLGLRFDRAATRAKVQWKRNGFRHSYISARVATLKDVPAVALECGNSPAVVFSNYRALLSEAEGQAWFNVLPPKQPGADIIPMQTAKKEAVPVTATNAAGATPVAVHA